MKKYDLVVIGAGTAGLTAAEVGVRLGASVALVESKDRLGGECLHSGCIPSKSLIHAARKFAASESSAEHQGAAAYKAAFKSIHESIHHIESAHDNADHYRQMGVDVFTGKATFINASQIQLSDTTILTGKKCIIATGSKPAVPAIDGLEGTNYLTNDTIFDIKELPKSMTIIGGGPIACELGQALSMFGTHVTILSNADRLLPRDEPEAGEALLKSFDDNPYITLVRNASVKTVRKDAGVTLTYKVNGKNSTVCSEALLIATGRKPNTELDLDVAKIAYTDSGITTNDKFQTTNKNVYAIGDVASGPNFTHVGVDQASVAVQNALLGTRKSKRSDSELVWATFTSPEIARLGADEASLKSSKTNYKKYIVPFADIDKAITDQEDGLIKILTSPKGLLLGVTIIGGPASELIGTFALAKKNGITLQQIGETLQPYPTYNFGIKLFASDIGLRAYESGYKKTLIRLLRKLS